MNADLRWCLKSQLRIGTKEYRGLVKPLAARLFEEPFDAAADIHGLVDLVVTLATKDMAEFSVFVHPLRERAFEAVATGMSSGRTSRSGPSP